MTTVGHRLGHQSGLYESSGQISVGILNGIVFRVSMY